MGRSSSKACKAGVSQVCHEDALMKCFCCKLTERTIDVPAKLNLTTLAVETAESFDTGTRCSHIPGQYPRHTYGYLAGMSDI